MTYAMRRPSKATRRIVDLMELEDCEWVDRTVISAEYELRFNTTERTAMRAIAKAINDGYLDTDVTNATKDPNRIKLIDVIA